MTTPKFDTTAGALSVVADDAQGYSRADLVSIIVTLQDGLNDCLGRLAALERAPRPRRVAPRLAGRGLGVRWRRLNRVRAALGGYFWLPCPLCGQMFGGHECRPRRDGRPRVVPDPRRGPGAGLLICPGCAAAGRGENPAGIALVFDLERDGGTWPPSTR